MKKVKAALAVAAVAAVVVGAVSYEYINGSSVADETVTYEETSLMYGDLTLEFTGEGTTQVASVSQYPDFDVSAVRMQVEEVYVASGDEVAEGDDLFKFTEDSYAELVSYYEEAVADALEAKEDAEDAYTQGVEEAELTYNESVAGSTDAQAEYDAAVAELQADIDSVYTSLVNAQTSLSTYQTNIANNQYYIDAGVADYKSLYESAQSATDTASSEYTAAKELYEETAATVSSEIENLQILIAQADDLSEIESEVNSAVAQLNSDNTALAEYLKAYESAAENLTAYQEAEQEAQSNYESAKSTYEKNESNAEEKVESLTSEIETLQEKYDEAVADQELALLELQNTYEKAILTGQNAQTEYDATVTTLQAAVDDATDSYNDLVAEQEALLACTDGVVHASQDGTLSSVAVMAEGYVMAETAVVAYYDTSEIMISTEVDQGDISKIAVGDTVVVVISGAGQLEGEISEIAAAATEGGSMSNVTYAVTVTLDNADGSLAAGSSAYVTFNYGEETDVYYTVTDALSDISGNTAKVKMYDDEGNITEVSVEIGTSTDEYTVITSGLTEDDKFLIETTSDVLTGEGEASDGESTEAQNTEGKTAEGVGASGDTADEKTAEGEREDETK
ncbi:MAG: HlyD family efflux transporter periplasmic adaptor subunit [Lachnospiraceae bacterium]|nr:HlyD family efflux transporter periplasmic adaptor subunit [Lachnospiraceae bacterium]